MVLENSGFPDDEVALFLEHFPDGLDISEESIRRIASVGMTIARFSLLLPISQMNKFKAADKKCYRDYERKVSLLQRPPAGYHEKASALYREYRHQLEVLRQEFGWHPRPHWNRKAAEMGRLSTEYYDQLIPVLVMCLREAGLLRSEGTNA